MNYLSLVVLGVEERVIVGLLDHVQCVFGGFVNDGQVEEPARKQNKYENNAKSLVKDREVQGRGGKADKKESGRSQMG